MTMKTTHKCPVNGCEEIQPRHLLMCARHWRQVPTAIQRKVLDGWRVGSGDYFVARQAAIDAVNASIRGI